MIKLPSPIREKFLGPLVGLTFRTARDAGPLRSEKSQRE